MEEIIMAEVKGIESEIIRYEAQVYEIEKHLTFLNSKRNILLSIVQKNNQPKTEGINDNRKWDDVSTEKLKKASAQ